MITNHNFYIIIYLSFNIFIIRIFIIYLNKIFQERESINNKNKFKNEINNKGFYSLYGKGIIEFKK